MSDKPPMQTIKNIKASKPATDVNPKIGSVSAVSGVEITIAKHTPDAIIPTAMLVGINNFC